MRNLSAIESARRFRDYHERPLAAEEVKYGLILRILGQLDADRPAAFLHWTLGGPGQCAVKMALHSIVLGALDETQSRQLPGLTAEVNFPAALGPASPANRFASQATPLRL